MYKEYAKDPRMRCNIGIRRRLAPLVDSSRRQVQLLHAILFGLPGSPFLYYGDELGMGDNIHLGDRDGVRTPMQWSGDRNGGFSKADFAELYFPPNMDPVFGYYSVNVESQMRNTDSLLYWVRDFIYIRKGNPIFGRGSMKILRPDNKSVFAFIREYKSKMVLCVYNLAHSAQPVSLDLHEYAGMTPVEMRSGTPFPVITQNKYFLSLAHNDFFWFIFRDVDANE